MHTVVSVAKIVTDLTSRNLVGLMMCLCLFTGSAIRCKSACIGSKVYVSLHMQNCGTIFFSPGDLFINWTLLSTLY